MRITTWNCNMAFRKKADAVLKYKPDISIIQECEHPRNWKLETALKDISDVVWYGNNHNKGLAILSFKGHKLQLLEVHNPEIQLVLPIAVTGGIIDLPYLQYGHTTHRILVMRTLDKYGKQYIIMSSC